jgi:catechol 2,3-dioxygenase-like lactoylglutathione lyase family enzyme
MSTSMRIEKDAEGRAGSSRGRLVGMNHIALEVGDVEAALAFYQSIFRFELFKRTDDAAFITMGDQFLVLVHSDLQHRDHERHFGLVVDDRSTTRQLASAAGATMLETRFLDFLDPWGNFIQVVEYGDIQFTKSAEVLAGMGLSHLRKTAGAIAELVKKGMSPAPRKDSPTGV